MLSQDEQKRMENFDHRVFVTGFSLHVVSGTLATIATFLDFNWPYPATPGLADPHEETELSVALSAFMLFYLAANFPSMLAWSTSAGWAFNTGFIWFLAAMGFYDRLRAKKVRVVASGLQSLFGIVALILAVITAFDSEQYYNTQYALLAHWAGSLGMLAASVLLTLVAFALALLSPSALKERNVVIGWQGQQAADEDEDDNDDVAVHKPQTVHRTGVAPKKCGDLGPCAICDLACSFVLLVLWFILIGFSVQFDIYEPDTSCFARISSDSGANPLAVANALKGSSMSIGTSATYWFEFDADDGHLTVFRNLSATEALPVFSTLPGEAFVRAGVGYFSADNSHEAGTFTFNDHNRVVSESQTVDALETDGVSYVLLSGSLRFNANGGVLIPYSVNFSTASVQPSTNHLAFDVRVDDGAVAGNSALLQDAENDHIRTYFIHSSKQDEGFFGFGESYSYWNLKGACVPIVTREQGIARGVQPLSYVLNRFANHAGGSWQTTYSAISHYVTSTLRSFFLEDAFFAVYDLTRPERITLEVLSARVRGRFIAETSPLDIIEQYTLFSGRMRALPGWTQEGAIVGVQGGTARVKGVVDDLIADGVPLAGVWIQDWSGKRPTSFGDRLLWNWEVDRDHYPGWTDMIHALLARNISTLTYINPYLADYAPSPTSGGDRVAQPMFLEALALGCLVRDRHNGTLIQFSATPDFTFATLDLTNPSCSTWYQDKMRANMLNTTGADSGVAAGAMGWMADFAESLPFDARYFSQDHSSEEMHNLFPALWAETNRQAIGLSAGGVDFSSEAVFFTRSASPKTPGSTTLAWLGDQMQAFNRFDGLATVVPALASGGLSGLSLSHSDIGGYLGINQYGVRIVRGTELLRRWMELSAFADSVFRSHEGNLISASPQVYSDAPTRQAFARFATLFKALAPYRKLLVQEAATLGHPVARHPFVHFPGDPRLHSRPAREIMLGDELLLCPALGAGVHWVDCYLPAGSGTWTEFFDSSATHTADPVDGLSFSCSAPLGKPCVLIRQGAVHVPAIRAELDAAGFFA